MNSWTSQRKQQHQKCSGNCASSDLDLSMWRPQWSSLILLGELALYGCAGKVEVYLDKCIEWFRKANQLMPWKSQGEF
eukprot:6113948-Amphidinium_carterae.1